MRDVMDIVKDFCTRMSGHAEEVLMENVCRSDEVTDATSLVYFDCAASYGCCFMEVGLWYWADDPKELALDLCEVQLKSVISRWHGDDLEAVIGIPCADYIRSTDVGTPEVRETLAGFAEELYGMIAKDDFVISMLNDWGKRLNACLEKDSDHMIVIDAFDSVEDAMALLEEHEGVSLSREEDEEEMQQKSLKARFLDDMNF